MFLINFQITFFDISLANQLNVTMNNSFFQFPMNLEHFLITLSTNFWTKVYFFQANSRFHWLLLMLFQEPAQDLTLFSFLEENCYIGWRTYKSAAYTKRNKYFYSSVSKSVRRQENYCYQWLHFFNSVWQKFFFLVGELSELLSCWQDGLAPAIKFCNDNWFFLKNK